MAESNPSAETCRACQVCTLRVANLDWSLPRRSNLTPGRQRRITRWLTTYFIGHNDTPLGKPIKLRHYQSSPSLAAAGLGPISWWISRYLVCK